MLLKKFFRLYDGTEVDFARQLIGQTLRKKKRKCAGQRLLLLLDAHATSSRYCAVIMAQGEQETCIHGVARHYTHGGHGQLQQLAAQVLHLAVQSEALEGILRLLKARREGFCAANRDGHQHAFSLRSRYLIQDLVDLFNDVAIECVVFPV